ncbi:MAG: glycosyltransferase family 4 protein [Anaerolineae bacterium]
MRLLIITTYYAPDSGAAAVRLTRLARILARRGHEVTVLTTLPHYPQGRIADAYRGKHATVEWRDGVQVVRAWLYATPSPRISRKLISQNSFMLSALMAGLGIEQPDVMLIEAQPVFTSFAGVLLSRLKRVPYVLNVSDLWPDHLLSVGTLTATHPIYRMARTAVDLTYRGASAIVTLSPAWAQTITGYIGETDKLHVIYNGVDLERFRPGLDAAAFRTRYDLGDAPLVTFIGTFATQYDFDAMVEVVRRLPAVQFAFIGSGSQGEKVAGFNLPNLRQIPWIAHEEMPQAWAASALTYWVMRPAALYRGTIPAKLYEALASGVPVIAGIEGAGAEMIDLSGGGISLPIGDLDCLMDAIAALLADDDLRGRYSAFARSYAEAMFNPERVADAYEAVLRTTL